VADAHGVHLTDAEITWTHAKTGQVSDWARAGGSLWTAQYTPPFSTEPGVADVIVDVTWGGKVFTKHFTFPLVAVATSPGSQWNPSYVPSTAIQPTQPGQPDQPLHPTQTTQPVQEAATAPQVHPPAESPEADALAEALGLPPLEPCGFKPVDDVVEDLRSVLTKSFPDTWLIKRSRSPTPWMSWPA